MIVIKIIAGVISIGLASWWWRLGGDGKPFWRKFGVPLLVLIYGLLATKWWGAPVAAGLVFAGSTLPLSLIGSNMLRWYNLLFDTVIGLLYGLAVAMIAWPNWLAGVGFIGAFVLYMPTAIAIGQMVEMETKQKIEGHAIQEWTTGAVIMGSVFVASFL